MRVVGQSWGSLLRNAALACALATAAAGSAAAQAVNLSNLPPHPRFYFTAATIDKMKQEAAAGPKRTMFEEILRRAQGYESGQVSTNTQQTLMLIVAGTVFERPHMIERAVENFNYMISSEVWATESIEPQLVYDWLYPHLSSAQRTAARNLALDRYTLGGQRTVYYNLEANEATFKGLTGLTFYGEGTAAQNQFCQALVDEWDGRMRGVREYRFPDGSAASRGGVLPTREVCFPDGGYYKGNHYGQKDMEAVITYLSLFKDLNLGNYFSIAGTYLQNWPEYMWRLRRPDGSTQRLMSGNSIFWEVRGLTALGLLADKNQSGEANWIMHQHGWGTYSGGSNTWAVPAVVWRPNGPITDLTSLPTYKLYGASGDVHQPGTSYSEKVIVRDGWHQGYDSDDVYFTLHAGDYFGDYYNYHQLAFELYYRGALAIRSGFYSGESHSYHYYARTVSTNTVAILDNSQSQLGDKWGTDWTYDEPGRPTHIYDVSDDSPYNAAEILAFEHGTNSAGENYFYTKGALNPDNAYYYTNDTRRVERQEREVVLQGHYLVVRDKIQLGGPLHSVRWLLHTIHEPVLSNPSVVSTTVPGHITTYARTSYSAQRTDDDYDGEMKVVPILPGNATLRKVGGAGYECWVDDGAGNGQNFPVPNDDYYTGREEAGQWRVETIAPPAADIDFVHAIFVSRPGEPMANVTAIDTPSAVGCEIDGVGAFAFARDPENQDIINYELHGAVVTPNLIEGMEPFASYDVRVGDATYMTVMASEAGSLSFDAVGPNVIEVKRAAFAKASEID